MPSELIALTFSSPEPEHLAGFWGGPLGQTVTIERGAPALTALPEVGFGLRFVAVAVADAVADAGEKWGPNQMHRDLKPTSSNEQAAAVHRAPKLGRNRLHLDLTPSVTSTIETEVARLSALGATRVDAGCAEA